jgi:hypothetical protein
VLTKLISVTKEAIGVAGVLDVVPQGLMRGFVIMSLHFSFFLFRLLMFPSALQLFRVRSCG